MEAAIRFSQNSAPGGEDQRFLKVDVTGKAFSLCKITTQSRKAVLYEATFTSSKVPAFRAFDWHPVDENFVAVGGSGGEATLLNIAKSQPESVSFSVRSQRGCNAVALSSHNLIAVGLEKVRTDFCLNIWDFAQYLPSTTNRPPSKHQGEPLYKLAGGEPITSLKFYNSDPQLLVAGVKDKLVRLYDLREPNNSNGVQFASKCVSNIAIDHHDDNYFASCDPTVEQLICVWDRRMSSRVSGSSAALLQHRALVQSPLELRRVNEPSSAIWSLRFSKSRRGCLGVLSSTGHLKVYDIGKDGKPSEYYTQDMPDRGALEDPEGLEDVFVHSVQDIERPHNHLSNGKEEKKRVVSFDFTTGKTRAGQPKIITLTGQGNIQMTATRADPEPIILSPTSCIYRGINVCVTPSIAANSDNVASKINKIRRDAEPRNALKQAFKSSKQNKAASSVRVDSRRMSSFANQSWNADLGYFERNVKLEDLLSLLAAPRLRCEAKYLLDPPRNRSIASDSQWIEAFWSWVERAERISRNKGMLQDNLDLSFVGVHSVWMEEISVSPRQTGASFSSLSLVIKNLVNRLNLPQRRGAHTDYPWHRKLCLYIAGLSWTFTELENVVQKLTASGQHTKAAATAIFADEEKLAYQALRARSASQSHKMLAMALAGARRRKATSSTTSSSRSNSDSEFEDDDWGQTISSLASDLTDPYARAILAYVKSGSWADVVNEDALPLKQRIGIALRHLSDSDLTKFIGHMTRQVISQGDIEGVILTGTGTREGLDLLQGFAETFTDLPTAILGLSVGGAARRFTGSPHDDKHSFRKLEAMHEAYRSMIMSWGLKFDRVRFDIAFHRALSGPQPSGQELTRSSVSNITVPRPKEQIRLICTYCTQSITQFHDDSITEAGPKTIQTPKNPLTSEKAAVVGTVCPKCGRHLPRCGVCDLWLGVPDESYAKWYNPASTTMTGSKTNGNRERNTNRTGTEPRALSIAGNSVDLTASLTASIVTTIGPPTSQTTAPSEAKTRSEPGHKSSSQSVVEDGNTLDNEAKLQQLAREKAAQEKKWIEVMHKFTVFCVRCSHGFHAEHAKVWFEGTEGREGHRVCPVPTCDCTCNG